jgi:hypothetical protein
MKDFTIVHLQIADLTFKIEIHNTSKSLTKIWLSNFNTYYQPYFIDSVKTKPKAKIKIIPKSNWDLRHQKKTTNFKTESQQIGKFNWEKSQGKFDIFSSFYFFDYFLRFVFAKLIKKYQGFILHASSIKVKNKLFIFAAPKQTGKTTIVSLCPFNYQKYADDNTIIRKKGKKILVYPCPFIEHNKKTPQTLLPPEKTNKIFFLDQGKENKITLIKDNKEKLFSFWKNIKTSTVGKEFIKKIDFYQLYFKKDKSIWEELIKK